MTDHTETENTIALSPSVAAEKHTTAARNAYIASKASAMEAAAYVYLVHLNTQAADGAGWLTQQIKARNGKIAEHNNEIPQRKDNVAAHKAELTTNPKAVADEQVTKDLNKTEKEWEAEKRIKIDTPRQGASRFTTICRLVLEFDYEYHASNTSRYCAVLEWLDAKFRNQLVTNVVPLVNAIKDAGGFEKVLFMQRHGEPEADGETADDRSIIETALKDNIKAAIATANVKASFAMDPSYATGDNVVVMYGRHDNGTISIIGEVPLENSEIDGMLRKLNDKVMLPVDDAAEFVSRVLSLGELVDTGKKTKHFVDNIPGAQAIEEYSLFSMVPDAAGAKLMVSACMAPTSIVVHAKPGPEIASNIVQTQDYLYMLKSSRKIVVDKLHDRTLRSLYTLSRDPVPVLNDGKASGSAISWCLNNTALAKAGRKTAKRRLFWDYMTKGSYAKRCYQPVNVETYAEQFSVTLTKAEIAKLFVEYLKQFKSVSPTKKGAQPMNIKFEADKLTVIFKGQKDYVLPITAELDKAFEITLRPKDVYGLFAKLQQFDVADVTLSGNIAGVLKASFADQTGEYDVYVPTCDDKLVLSPKYFAKINAPVPVNANAADIASAPIHVEIVEAEADAVPA